MCRVFAEKSSITGNKAGKICVKRPILRPGSMSRYTNNTQEIIHPLFRLLKSQLARLSFYLLMLQVFALSDVPIDLQNRDWLVGCAPLSSCVAY